MGYSDYDYGYNTGWGGMGMGTSTTHFRETDYEVGTLVCDVFSSKAKKLVWQGVGKGTVDADPKTNDESIPKAVAAIMAKYPLSAN